MKREIGLYPIGDSRISLDEKLRLIKEAGFEYVAASKVKQLEDTAEGGFMQGVKKYGLPIDNVHLTGKDTNLVWYEGEDGDAVIDRYCREMEIAARAGVTLGIVHVTWGFSIPPFGELGLSRFERLVKHAEKVGFTVAFENSVCLTHLRGVIENYRSPNVRYCFDSGHHNEFCRETDLLSEFGHLLSVTHINDNDGVHDHHVIPFDGNADFTKHLKGLKSMQRLTFEVSGFRKKECTGSAADIRRDNFDSMAFSNDPRLLDVRDGGYSFYPALSYSEYLDRLMASAQRLCHMIDEA